MQLLDKVYSRLAVTPVCPKCHGVIASADVNVANDIAFCRNCNVSYSLSALSTGAIVDENVDVSRPPAGAWFNRMGPGLVTGATHRSPGQAFGLLFFCLFWNGIVSVFVGLAFAATLHHLGVAVPHWFPNAKGTNLPVPMTIFLWLFLTPFIAIGALLLGTFLSCLAGRTEVNIEGGEGTIFTGIGALGSRKRFSVSSVKDVRIEQKTWQSNNGQQRRAQIVIDADPKPIYLGSMLNDSRRAFLAGVLKRELVH